MRKWLQVLALVLLGTTPVQAQDAEINLPLPVLVIDPERVFSESKKGQAIRSALDAEAVDLQQENNQIVEDLIAEEQDLAVRRPDMDPEVFRAEAEAFNDKAQEIRQARDAKERDLARRLSEARTEFFEDMRPVVGEVLIARGGAAVMDSRSVYLVLRSADITDEVIAAIDALPADTAEQPVDE